MSNKERDKPAETREVSITTGFYVAIDDSELSQRPKTLRSENALYITGGDFAKYTFKRYDGKGREYVPVERLTLFRLMQGVGGLGVFDRESDKLVGIVNNVDFEEDEKKRRPGKVWLTGNVTLEVTRVDNDTIIE
ncbi:MAG: hypothetical protein KGH60_00720 [Candidatus Micrarchaeota archaeon]|nr:hypothetical protein [Candidatus Micrarchaeota archaeon]